MILLTRLISIIFFRKFIIAGLNIKSFQIYDFFLYIT